MEHNAEKDAGHECERDECHDAGITYWVRGRNVQWIAPSGAAMASSTTTGLQPSGSVRLCSAHAIDSFGVSG